MVLDYETYLPFIERFNANDEETVIQYINNDDACGWLTGNIPLFDCPDEILKETYYFRWWLYRKHLKKTPDGFIITEFLPEVSWSGKHNSINCAASHHIREGRWLAKGADFLPDYILFWFRHGGSLRSYSVWLADAVVQYCDAIGDYSLAIELLPDFVANYETWEQSNQHQSGLFWSNDDRDAMEYSISGPGLRPTLNSYLFADALAIVKIARQAGQPDIERRFGAKADDLKRLVQERLWDAEGEFFKVIPLASKDARVETWDFSHINPVHNAREQIGYIPWYFRLPDAGYEVAWKQLMEEEGFLAPYGPTTAEQRHSRFMEKHPSHECLWNGPSWPFATSQTLTAMANLLMYYQQDVVTKQDYLKLLHIYAQSHYRVKEDGTKISWLDENLDPYNGEWLSRRILQGWNWREDKAGYERGKDYNHSTFCDLIISGLIGVQSQEEDAFAVHPLVDDNWDYFCLDHLPYKGRTITVLFDRTGTRYGRGKGLRIYADGSELAHVPHIMPVTSKLQGGAAT